MNYKLRFKSMFGTNKIQFTIMESYHKKKEMEITLTYKLQDIKQQVNTPENFHMQFFCTNISKTTTGNFLLVFFQNNSS